MAVGLAVLALFAALSPARLSPAMAQTQNSAQTGAGGALETLQALQTEIDKQWAGPPGQLVKGAVGVAGLAAALLAAEKALTYSLRVRGDASVDSVSTTTTTSTSTSTSSSTSSSSSTN
ncbi:MAG: hypothetical protein ISR50_14530 [Alphaproteobacteria bacterium]|nr:hypothetical protein [Alphaproteobacteria bacterium]